MTDIFFFISCVVSIIFLIVLAISDYKTLSISVTVLLLYAVSICSISFSLYGMKEMMLNFGFGCCMLLSCNFISMIWFKNKYGKDSVYIDHAIGKGDILFCIMSAPAFNIMQYISFMTLSSCLGLIYHIVFRKNEVPYVCMSAIVMLVFIIVLIFREI